MPIEDLKTKLPDFTSYEKEVISEEEFSTVTVVSKEVVTRPDGSTFPMYSFSATYRDMASAATTVLNSMKHWGYDEAKRDFPAGFKESVRKKVEG